MNRWAALAAATLLAVLIFTAGALLGGVLGIAIMVAGVAVFVLGFATVMPQSTSLARDD